MVTRFAVRALSCAILLSTITIGSTSAADLKIVTKAPPLVAPDYNWTGFYVGGFAAYNWGDLDMDAASFASTGDITDNFFSLGWLGGYRQHFSNNWVFGASLTLPLFHSELTAVDTQFFPAPAFNPPVSYEAELNYSLTGSIEIGYAMGRWLPFVTAGIGFLNATYYTYNVIGTGTYSPGAVQEATNTHFLWTVGIGIDYGFTENLVGGLRLTYTDLSKENYEIPWNAPPPNPAGAHGGTLMGVLLYRL